MALIITITQAGREAIINAENNGTAPVRVGAIGVTAQAFTPSPDMSSLPGESKRIGTLSGGATAPDTIHVTVRDSTAEAYTVRGVGMYLEDGTLFAVYGQSGVVAEKSAQAALLMAVDVMFADINAESLSFGDTNFNLNQATTTAVGVVRLSTVAEARGGTDKESVITPEALRAARYQPGQIVITAGKSPLLGTLQCTGAAVSRTQYKALFDCIGTIYGAGDGSTTFNLPAMKEGTTVTQSTTAEWVGVHSPGQVISHTHGASAAAVGDHVHHIGVYGAGGHTHSASSSAGGDHIHGAWTDEQGWHGHSGNTAGAGDHQHTTTFKNNGPVSLANGGSAAMSMSVPGNLADMATSVSGHHGHSFNTDGAGNHGHNIGMNGVGHHTHDIGVAAVGDHAHNLDNRGAGAHDHAITVNSTGGGDNLPAGLRMLYCIAY
jgi:microcystin-dependent protein